MSTRLVMSKIYRTLRITSQAYDKFVAWAKARLPYGATLSSALETLVDMFKD